MEVQNQIPLHTARFSWVAALLFTLLLLGAVQSSAKGMTCEICKRIIGGGENVVLFKDQVREVKKTVCETCAKLEHTCTLCSLPIYGNSYTDLGDGRRFCDLDSKDLILEDSQAGPILDGVKIDIQRIFAQWPPVPDKGISIHVVSQKEFVNAHRDHPETPDADGLLGVTLSRKNGTAGWEHQIYILKGLGVAQFTAVVAHETTHVWLNEHGTRSPALHPDAREGFCEFIARQVMLDRGIGTEVKRIEKNAYSRGQIDAFIEADKNYTFHRTVDWVLNGVDTYLRTDKLDRLLTLREGVRALQPRQSVAQGTSGPVQHAVFPATPPAPAPAHEKLVLKGISRAGRSSLALINNRTLGVGEKAQVRIGDGSVLIKCLSIKADSVIVQYEGSNRQQELLLSGP